MKCPIKSMKPMILSSHSSARACGFPSRPAGVDGWPTLVVKTKPRLWPVQPHDDGGRLESQSPQESRRIGGEVVGVVAPLGAARIAMSPLREDQDAKGPGQMGQHQCVRVCSSLLHVESSQRRLAFGFKPRRPNAI
jgi:hypothetical protein